jgi:hypothetical protein
LILLLIGVFVQRPLCRKARKSHLSYICGTGAKACDPMVANRKQWLVDKVVKVVIVRH